MCNRFSDFNVKSDKGKTPLIVLRCADNRQLFEGTGKGNGKAMKYAIYEGNIDRLEKKLKRISNKCNQSSVELVSNALVWISEQEENNNYIHNLKTACSLEYVKGNFGLYASLFPAYDRDLERTAKRKAVQSVEQSSKFVGEISDRITVKIQSVKCVTSWETDFGITRIYKLIGADGNVYTWKTGKYLDDAYFTGKKHEKVRKSTQYKAA